MKVMMVLCFTALLTGAIIPIQAAANAALSQSIGSVVYSALVLFTIGLVSISLYLMINRIQPPSIEVFFTAPRYAYIGGLIVATYVLSITYLAPRLGVGNAICFIVTGQIIAAVIIDHFGLMGATVFSISYQRVSGVTLMVAGLFLARC